MAGLAVLDVVLNLPELSPAAPVGSLLVPSLDLLVAGAALLLVPYAPTAARGWLRLGICLVLVTVLSFAAATRFGSPAALLPAGAALGKAASARAVLGWAAAAVLLLGAGAVAYFASGLVLKGFEQPVVRSVFTVVVAFCAIVQVITGRHVFAPGEIPRIAHLALAR